MRERLVEDWLTRINERGYQAAFGQVLVALGHRVLRISHSPYEHGRDVITIAPSDEVCGFQLKDGDIGIKEWDKEYGQVVALVETRPDHPALAGEFVYRPHLVTTGTFSDPVLDRVRHHNREWNRRGLPQLEVYDGRWLQREFLRLSIDFWPIEPPDVRAFRRLYLVDGRGDLNLKEFSRFATALAAPSKDKLDVERRAVALSLFCSYLLGEFYRENDHWSVFRGWIIAASTIAAVSTRLGVSSDRIEASISIAQKAAGDALFQLAQECQGEHAFKPTRLEWDEYTKLRNLVACAAWSTRCLMGSESQASISGCLSTIKSFTASARFSFLGEAAFAQLCPIVWLCDQHGEEETANKLLQAWLALLLVFKQPESEVEFPDPYTALDEQLEAIAQSAMDGEAKRKTARQAYSLLPTIILLVRRGQRHLLSTLWQQISRITMTSFQPENAAGYLDWACDKGMEQDFTFAQPQSWAELVELADHPPTDRLPAVLERDWRFRLMFLLAFPHRIAWSIVGSLDHQFKGSPLEKGE